MMPYAVSRFIRRLRLIFDRRAFERDLDDEMRFHMDMAAARHIDRGASPADAGALTTRELGSMDRFKDEVRDAHGLTLSDDIARDVRFAVRTLRRTPGFTALALLTFGLGIRLVLEQATLLALGGIVVGLLGAVLLSRLLAGLLYGVGTHDPLTFVTVPVVLALVALLASMVPAWGAARVDPVIALRSE